MTTPTLRAAIATLRATASVIEVATADTEPAPVSPLLFRDQVTGKHHRVFRVEGIEGFATYPGCDLSDAEVIPDLSKVADELTLHDRCFGRLDAEVEA